MTDVRVTTHAVKRAQERLGWHGSVPMVMGRLKRLAHEALAADPPRRSCRRPRWAVPDGRPRRRTHPHAGRVRFLWTKSRDVAFVVAMTDGAWVMLTVIAADADTSGDGD